MIAILDWGVGGWFSLRALRAREPTIDVLYLSDSGAVPYGRQGRRELAATVHDRLRWLADHGATQVLLACHSASTALLDIAPPIPTAGVIDASAAPVDAARVLILGGERTIRSGRWRAAVRARLPGADVTGRVAQPLSAWIEAGEAAGSPCQRHLARLLRGRWDTTILACTHYAALASSIQRQAPEARIVDPALVVAARIPLVPGSGRVYAYTSGDPRAMSRVIRQLFSEDIAPDVAPLTPARLSARRRRPRAHAPA